MDIKLITEFAEWLDYKAIRAEDKKWFYIDDENLATRYTTEEMLNIYLNQNNA